MMEETEALVVDNGSGKNLKGVPDTFWFSVLVPIDQIAGYTLNFGELGYYLI